MITRRLAIFRIAASSAVAVTAAAPAVLAAVQPATTEDPALIRLSHKMAKLDQICRKAAKTAARAVYDAFKDLSADPLS